MEEMFKIFLKTGRVKGDDEYENVAAVGRNQVTHSYEQVFHDELEREDMKLRTTQYPEMVVDPRRRQELADGGMVREDRRAIANLPERASHYEYPRLGYYSNPYIDSITKVKARKGTK